MLESMTSPPPPPLPLCHSLSEKTSDFHARGSWSWSSTTYTAVDTCITLSQHGDTFMHGGDRRENTTVLVVMISSACPTCSSALLYTSSLREILATRYFVFVILDRQGRVFVYYTDFRVPLCQRALIPPFFSTFTFFHVLGYLASSLCVTFRYYSHRRPCHTRAIHRFIQTTTVW